VAAGDRRARSAQRGVTEPRQADPLLEERIAQLESLALLSAAVARAATSEDVYAYALDCLQGTLEPDRAAILLFDEDGVMRFKAWRRLSVDYRAASEGHTPWAPETVDPAPVLVADVADDPELAALRPVIEREGIRALGFFPLVHGERLLGKFMVYFDEPHVFSGNELRLAQAIGDHIALAIGRHRAEAELRRQTANVERARWTAERLRTVAQTLVLAFTVRDVANVVAREVRVGLGAAAAWVACIAGDERKLERMAAIGYQPLLEESYAALPLLPGNPTTDAVLEGRALWFEDAQQVVGSYPSLADDYPLTRFEAMAVVPVLIGERPRGVIVLNFDAPRSFGDEEQALLVTIAAQCAQGFERARLYEELEARANAASILAHVGDGVFQVDAHDRIAYWNRAAEAITGISAEIAVGADVTALFPQWQELAGRIDITDTPRATGRRGALRVQVGGRDFAFAISGVATPDSVVYAFRDVTASEELEAARRDFVATASHELRTPLGSVFGATKTLLRRELDEEMRRRLLEIIDQESERLAATLDTLLLASRLDADRLELAVGPCDLAALAADVVEVERMRTPDTVTITLQAPPSLPLAAADAQKTRQVLTNLLENASKYSPDGGTIAVALEADAREVRVSVADEGLGVPYDERDRIFEKFYRLDPNLTRGVGGTGLGLFICRQLIERMNGRIWLESRQGTGSCFVFSLPQA